jgi:hypothetical protein
LWKGYGGGLGTAPQRKNPIFGRLGILAQGGVAARLQEFTSAALLFLALHPNFQAINIAPL